MKYFLEMNANQEVTLVIEYICYVFINDKALEFRPFQCEQCTPHDSRL